MIPIGATVLILFYLVNQLRDYALTQDFWIALGVSLVSIFIFGWLSTTLIAKPLFRFLEEVMSHAPLVKMVYTSIKDLTEAFVGNKKKFDRPVLVKIDPADDTWRMGFVTREELHEIQLPGHSAVYIPMSYSLSGHLLIVPRENLKHVDAQSPEALRFVVSGGVTGIQKSDKDSANNNPG